MLLCGCRYEKPCSDHAAKTPLPNLSSGKDNRVECKLTAEEKLLFQAIMRVIDDGDLPRGDPYRLYETFPIGLQTVTSEAEANAQRLRFSDSVIDTWRRFKYGE